MMNMMSPTPSRTSVLSSIIATCNKVLQFLHDLAAALLAVFLTSSSAPPSNFHIIRVACPTASYKTHRHGVRDHQASGGAEAYATPPFLHYIIVTLGKRWCRGLA